MDSQRIGRVAWVAVMGVMFVALITILSRSGKTEPEPARTEAPVAQVPLKIEDATGSKVPIDSGTPDASSLQDVGRTVIQRADKKTGRLVQEFIFDKVPGLGKEGEFDVKNPEARLHRGPNRVIVLRSEEGRFVAPGNVIQSGVFKKNLLVTLYQCAKDVKLDLKPDSPHRALLISLPEGAAFDATLGELVSPGPVRLTTPITGQADFSGRGLRMVHNSQNNTIDYLEVTHGESLRFRPAKAKEDTSGSAEKDPQKNAEKKGDAKNAKYYRIDFGDNVVVTSDGSEIKADELVAFLSVLDGDFTEQAADKSRVEKPKKEGDPAAPEGEQAESPDDKSGEVVVKWQGKMVMVPTNDPPPQIVGRNDLYVKFTGSPLDIKLKQGDSTVVATVIDYLHSVKKLTVVGSEVHPLRLDSPQLGQATAPKLVLNMTNNTGEFVGPGWIKAPPAAATDEGDAAKGKRSLPPDFNINWSNGVNLVFDEAGKPGDPAIRSAKFVGGVRIKEPRFEMSGEQVETHFAKAFEGKQQRLEKIDAMGNVDIKAKDTRELEEGEQAKDSRIRADKLNLELDTAADSEMTPLRLVAEKDVVIERGDALIAAQFLDATFRPKAAEEEKADEKADEKSENSDLVSSQFAAQIATLKARGNVRLRRDGTEIHGDSLDADNDKGEAVLKGSPLKLAKLTKDDKGNVKEGVKPETELHVPLVNIKNRGKQVFADGAGHLVYTKSPKEEGPALIEKKDSAAPKGKDSEPHRVTVKWTDSMKYDGGENLILVFGDVVMASEDSPKTVNTVKAKQVTLELIDPDVADKVGGKPGEKKKSADGFSDFLGTSNLRHMVARENVEIIAERWHDDDRKNLDMRLKVFGDKLDYTQATGIAVVEGGGNGRMVVQHYPVPGKESPAKKKTVSMSGFGDSLFTWSGLMTLDAQAREAVLEENVYMTHQPQGDGPLVELKTDKLVAKMGDLKTVEPIAMSDNSSYDIQDIKATGNVRVTQGLRWGKAEELYFDGKSETVIFTATPPRKVEVYDPKQAKPLRSQRILWNLKTNEFEIYEPKF